MQLTLLAALLHTRSREITDTLVELLITVVHRIHARTEQCVTGEFVAELKRVSGKENILFKISEAAMDRPDGLVRDVVYPATSRPDQPRHTSFAAGDSFLTDTLTRQLAS